MEHSPYSISLFPVFVFAPQKCTRPSSRCPRENCVRRGRTSSQIFLSSLSRFRFRANSSALRPSRRVFSPSDNMDVPRIRGLGSVILADLKLNPGLVGKEGKQVGIQRGVRGGDGGCKSRGVSSFVGRRPTCKSWGRLERGLDSEGVLSLSILMLLIKPPTASVLVLSLFPSHSLLLLFALSVSFSLPFVPVLATLLYAITLLLALYRE